MLRQIWIFSNSKIGLLLIGFALTTILGAVLTNWLQRSAWQHQTELEQHRQDLTWQRDRKFELLQRRLDDGQRSLEEISDLINLRFFRLQKVYEAAVSQNRDDLENIWASYMDTVEKWNVKLIINQNKMARLINSEMASQFNNYETDAPQLDDPQSLHGHFYLSHKGVRALLECARDSSCPPDKMERLARIAEDRLRSLDYFSDAFVDEASSLFLERTFDLKEFREF